MQSLKKIPFFLLLLVLFFCLHGTAENYGALNAGEVFYTGISILIFVLMILLPVLLFTRNMLLAALISVFICGWFLFFGALHDLVKSIGFLHVISSYKIFIPLLIIATMVWIIFLKKRKELWPKLILYLNILLIVYCAVDFLKIGYLSVTTKAVKQDLDFNYSAVTKKPDIFLLLFDGYPGQKSLTDSFHYSNKPLYDFLEADSFRFLPISANYNVTPFSMASMLNMKYISPGYDANHIGQQNLLARQNEINNAALFTILQKAGYRLQNNSFFDMKDQPGFFNSNGFILAHNFLLTDKILLNRLTRDIGGELPHWVQKIPFLQDMSPAAHLQDNKLIIEKLSAQLNELPGNKPVFCYTHLMMPHGPYLYDSSGRPTNAKTALSAAAWMNRNDFISYLAYTNGIVRKLVTEIRQKRPGAIVIFMSDHGFREYLDDKSVQAAHFDNVCAVHFPDGQYGIVPDTLTNVNFFPYLLNAQFGQKLPYSDNKAISLQLK